MERNTRESIEARVDRQDCWLWLGQSRSGYGQVNFDGAIWRVHRLFYSWHVGPLEQGMVIDHLCGNRSCCNPAHLEQVTNAENLARAASRRTACRNGHATAEFRRRAPNGDTYCLMCHRVNQRKR
jgi:hypothetical protein